MATKLVRQPDGSITEEPAWYMTPKDLCLLIDRFQVLFERPSVISQHQGLTVTSEFSADALREFIDATRGRAGPSRMECHPCREHRPVGRLRRLVDKVDMSTGLSTQHVCAIRPRGSSPGVRGCWGPESVRGRHCHTLEEGPRHWRPLDGRGVDGSIDRRDSLDQELDEFRD